MKKVMLLMLQAVILTACNMTDKGTTQKVNDEHLSDSVLQTMSNPSNHMITISINEHSFQVILEDNETANALKDLLPLTLDMSELNGNEKYHYLAQSLPTAPQHVGHIREGDIILFGNNCLVVFYKGFSTSYTYTRIGHITSPMGLENVLGKSNVTITFGEAPQDLTSGPK